MARRCGTCYLEIWPGDKACRRCGAPVKDEMSFWQMALIALGCGAVLALIILYFFNR
jgi:hypothetical protein